MEASSVAVPPSRKASTDSEADMASPGQSAKPRKRVPASIWENKRPIITRLYQEEKKSLKEVMEIMERDYHFVATVKMYKSRIWKWGLDKKLKGDEVLAIMLLKRDRDALKKPTEFRIRGQAVDLENINRYLKRNPSLMARLRAGQTPSVQTTIEVTCHTPPPSPSPQRALAPSTEMQSTEQVLVLFRDYVDASFSSGAWMCEYDVKCSSSRLTQGDRSNDLFERVIASFALVNRCMIKGDQIDINPVLGPAFELLKQLVAAESPNFVARTVCLLWYLERHHKHDLLRLVLVHLAELIPIVLGPYHVLAAIWKRLGATEFTDYYELSMRLYELLLPEIEDRVGSANYLTHLMYSDYLDCIYARQDPEDCEPILRRHCARAEASGQRHPWIGDMALSHAGLLATCMDNQGRQLDAIEVLKSHMNTYSMTDDQRAAVHLELGVKYYRMCRISEAVGCFKSALRISLTSDVDERISMSALANLERMLRETGKTAKADRVNQYRMDRLAVFAEKSASLSKGFSDDDEDDSEDEQEKPENLPEWLSDDEEEETTGWLEIDPFLWEKKTSPASFVECPIDRTLEWTQTGKSESPGVLSTEYSPRSEDHIVEPEVEYIYEHGGGI